jgi:hypothetical protein
MRLKIRDPPWPEELDFPSADGELVDDRLFEEGFRYERNVAWKLIRDTARVGR